MGVDYRKQYEPDQLEPFWPNEIIKMMVVVLCTLALIMFLVILPVLLEMMGVTGLMHAEEPANPRGSTPVGIKPEWYFLAVYQYLRIWPPQLLGISGKVWGVLSQGPLVMLLVFLPFLYRRRAAVRPGRLYWLAVTAVIAVGIAFTFWGGWPEDHDSGGEQLISLGAFFHHNPLFFIFTALSIVVFYLLIAQEQRTIRRIMGPPRPPHPEETEQIEQPQSHNADEAEVEVGAAAESDDAAGPREPARPASKHASGPPTGTLLIIALAAVLARGVGLAIAAAPAHGADQASTQDDVADPFDKNNCVQCHSSIPGTSSKIVELEWKHSVHFGVGVGCEGCHGGDATLSREQFTSDESFKRAAHLQRHPDFLVGARDEREFISAARGRSVSYVCGKCHSDIKEKHLGSPHGDFGDPSCLYCHGEGTHRITKPSPQIIDLRSRAEGGRCTACHQASTMETVRRTRETLEAAEKHIDSATALSAELAEWGYRDLTLEQLHQNAAVVNSGLRQVFHSFNMREINSFAGEIRDSTERVEDTHALVSNLRTAQRQQAMVGTIAVIWLLSFSGLLLFYKKRFAEHGETESAPSAAGKREKQESLHD